MDPSGKQWAKKQIRGFSTAMFVVGTLGFRTIWGEKRCKEFAYKLAVNGKTSPFYFIVTPYLKKKNINLRQIIILGPQNSKNLLLSNFKLEFNIFRILSHSSGYNRCFFIAKEICL